MASHATIAQVNADGSLDAAFNPGTAANDNSVLSLVLLADGKVVIGGSFPSYNGVARNGIARLNADGTLDTSFESSPGPGGGGVGMLAVQADGKLIVGGGFTSYNGVARNRIARVLATAAEPPPPPPPPVELDLWSAGRDLVANEQPDAAKETAAINATVPQWSYGYRATVAGTDFTPFASATHTNADRSREAVEGWSASEGVVLVNTGAEPVLYFAGTWQLAPLFPSQCMWLRRRA